MNWKLIRHIDRYAGIPLLMLLSFANKCFRKPGQSEEIHSLLLIKFWGIGNLFMMLPALSRLRSTYPNVSIHLLTLVENREALSCFPSFVSTITIDTSSSSGFLNSTLRAIRQIRALDCDLVIDFEQFARFSPMLAALGNSRHSIGFKTLGQHRHHLYSKAVTYDNSIHTKESFLRIVEPITGGAGKQGKSSPLLPPSILDSAGLRGGECVSALGIPPDAPFIVMHVSTSSNFRERRWPLDRFIKLADLLQRNHGAWTIFTGFSRELDTPLNYKNIPSRCINRIDQLSFPDYFSLIHSADLVISADTSAVHIASALDTPVMGLYGPNTPTLYGPWGMNGLALTKNFPCSPCITNFNSKINNCRHPDGKGACMGRITVDELYYGISEILRNSANNVRRKSLQLCDN